MSAIQKSPETNYIAYAHSDKIENLKNIIEQNGGLSEDDVKAFSQYREDVRRGRIKDAALGGVVMGTLIGGTAALFGHHSVEHGGTDHRVIGVAKPGAAEASVPSAQPGIHTGNEPIVKIEETTPGHGLHLTSEYQKVLSGEIAKGDTKAAQHLAEVELRGQLGKIGEHFKNHADFEKARDTLVAGWHTKHPEMFGVDGSIKPEHMNDIAATLQSVDAKTVLESSTTFLVADNAIGPHHLAAEPHGIGAAEHSAKAMTPAETENAAREHLNQVAGAKVPPTWHTGGDYAAYNQGKSLNDVGTIEALKGKQISSDSLHYLKKLLELHRLKPEDVHVSPDGKHLMFNAPNSAARNIIWTTELRDKSVFSRLFPGQTADVKEIFPQGQAKIDAATIVQPKNIDQPASHIEKSSLSTPDSHNVVNPEKSSLSTPDKSVVVDGNKDLHAGGQTGEEQNLHTQPADQANVAAEHVVQKASEVKFSEIPKDVLDNMSKDHPDWSDAQKLEDYQEYLKSLGM
jgi:hypothetical protein